MTMDGSSLYLVPCDNPQLHQHFERVVLNGIEERTHQNYINENHDEPLHLWGLPQQKGERHRRMDTGDFLLFYLGDERYRYAARVLGIEQNRELIQALEDKFSKEMKNTAPLDRWQYCVYLQSPFPVTIDSKRLHDYAGHSSNRPFNTIKLNKQGHKAITEEYGDIESYLLSENKDSPNDSSDQSIPESSMQFESVNEVVDRVSKKTGTRASTVSKDVSKLDKRDIPLHIVSLLPKRVESMLSERHETVTFCMIRQSILVATAE